MIKPKKREKQRNRYPEGLKRKIAKEYLSGTASYGILAEEHNLANKGVVKEFVKWYKRKLTKAPKNEQFVKDLENNNDEQSSISSDLPCISEVKKLRKELELSRLKTEMLETMIDEAERILVIDIRKKSGTNQ